MLYAVPLKLHGAVMSKLENARAKSRWFYFILAIAMLATALAGFLQSYFAPLAAGGFKGPPLHHIHGIFFFSWMLLFAVQTWLVASGRTAFHRELGLLGVAIATAMAFSVMVTVVERIHFFDQFGTGDGMRVFTWVQVGGMLFFASLVALAIAKNRRPEIHKRLMLLATISILDAPIARIIGMNFLPPPPPGPPAHAPVTLAVMGGLAACAFLAAAIVYDWKTRGRPHPVYLWGGAAFVVFQLTRVPISESAAWMSVATFIGGLGG